MRFTDDTDLEAACFAVAGYITFCTRAGRPVPAAVHRLHRDLELTAIARMSDNGPETGSGAAPSEQELINSETAADILGCTPRHVRRLARDLDGHRITDRQWVFVRTTVEDYEKARRDARRTQRSG